MKFLRRHPAQVTADRLADHVETYGDYLDGTELDEISRVVFVLEQIANGEREKFEVES